MRTLQLIIFCFITLLSSFAQSNSNIKITWIDTPNEVSESVLTVKWGIKADSQIKDVNILLNGQQTKGINAVSNDGYDMKKSRVFNLTKGENKIEITVTTLTGSQKASKVIKYITNDNNNNNNNNVVVNDFGNFECLDSMLVAAYRSNPEAQYLLGKSYLNGKNGFEKDLLEAALWFKKSAENSCAPSQYEYSISLFEGRGIYKNIQSALTWLDASVKQEYPEALLKMGILYENGTFVKKDIEKAAQLYKKCRLKEAKERLNKLGK